MISAYLGTDEAFVFHEDFLKCFAPATICTWGHFILTIIYWANVIVVTLLAENHKISLFGKDSIVWTLERYSSTQY